ncbi:MAG: tRNA pseudouridine(54/55) synthase Pus10 [Desulfurococcales archaeon ex4484_58]|nr:MAG: tRNA pseudouridine(54/55) synthase Pus10 [Desulfurococcales archaeon ex4484_58]
MEKSNTIVDFNELITKAYSILKKYPLCNHCLGRLFAKYGLELRNEERGFAVKTMLQIHLYELIKKKQVSEKELRIIAENGGEPFTRLYKKLYEENIQSRSCYICNNKLSRKYFEEIAANAANKLLDHNVYRFLVGVSLPPEIMMKELEVYQELGLETTESLKNEMKREIGKIIRERYGLEPDFNNPEATVIIDFSNDTLHLIVSPILLEGRYWKRGRNISHTPWINREGVRVYPYSIQEFFEESLKEVFDAEKVILHASGREDVDARMLGEGRPMVLEIKKPKFRYVDLGLVNELIRSDLISGYINGYSSRARIEYLKGEGSKKAKAYKLLVFSEKTLSGDELKALEEFFRDREIKQKTPSRILRRKRDVLRIRKVYEIKTFQLNPQVFDVLIYCSGGLYVKELIHGDNGRTTPSFTEVLGTKLYPLEIDVFGVETL